MLGRSSVLAVLALAGTCAREVASAPTNPVTTPSTLAQPQPDPTLEQLAAAGVYDDDFARAELYSWTTTSQLARLRETEQLLVADAATGGRPSPLNRALRELADSGNPLAALLVERPELGKRRYAWPSPFATTMGLGPRRYGDALIRIELDERGWIVRFDPRADPAFSAVDMHGDVIAIEQLLAAPERIAAIFHVRGPPRDPIAYRELVVCNEAMVAAWSIATPEIAARVEAEITMVEALRKQLAHLPREAALESAVLDWHHAAVQPTPLQLWHASLAFDNPRYLPLDDRLAKIAATLRGNTDDGGPPLRVLATRPAETSSER